MRSIRRIALLIAVGALGLFTAGGLAMPGGLATQPRAATSLDGTWNGWQFGDTMVKTTITGTLEGGFTITAAESLSWGSCSWPAGSHLATFSPSGNGTYNQAHTQYSYTTYQNSPGKVTCDVEQKSDDGWTVTGDANTVDIGGSYITLTRESSPTTTTPTTPTTTTPTTPTTTKPKLVGKLVVTLYEMPDRYGTDADHNGLVDALTTPEQVNRAVWTAKLKVYRPHKGCDPSASYSWQIDGRIAELERTKTKCVFTYTHFKKLGPHRVNVAATKNGMQWKGSNTVTLKDLLIVGLGDSNGSGEGNPDNPGSGVSWIDVRCDRSHYSYQARTAEVLEGASNRTSVTFVHLACSGASLTEGLLGGYSGINDPGGGPLLPQVVELKRLIQARTSETAPARQLPARPVDALILSVGVNDLHFGAIVIQCISQAVCWKSTGLPGAAPGETVDQARRRWRGEMPHNYDRLASLFDKLKIEPGRIYITEYFDSLRNDKKEICDPLIGNALTPQFTHLEAEWAYSHFLVPLNKTVAAAAIRNDWRVVRPPVAFRKHGYCAENSWIVPITGSAWEQLDLSGTMHANFTGHLAQRVGVVAALKRHGIDGTP